MGLPRESEAAVSAIPIVAVASLEALEFAVGVAATAGVITVVQQQNYQIALREKINSIESKTEAVTALVFSFSQKLFRPSEKQCRIDTLKEKTEPSAEIKADGFIVNHSRVYDHPDSNCNGLYSKCCEALRKEFEKKAEKENKWVEFPKYNGSGPANLDPKTKGALTWAVSGVKGLLCCLNFDRKNMGFEIFSPDGQHLGERRCSDVSNDDLCSPTDAAKASDILGLPKQTFHTGPLSDHFPRGGCVK